MKLDNFIPSSINLDAINSMELPSFLTQFTSPSPDIIKSLSSMPLENLLYIMGGLMLFRMFGGMIFSVLGLLSLVLTTATSVICSVLAVFVRIFGSTTVAAVNLFGSIFSCLLSTPISIFTGMIARWGRFMVPVVASGLMSTFYLQGDQMTSWISELSFQPKSEWVSLEKQSPDNDMFEKF